VQAPPGDSLQPEATGAGMEETKCLKPSDSGSRRGHSAVVNAPTLILIGDADDWTPAAACREMVAQPMVPARSSISRSIQAHTMRSTSPA
jgi:hypothetical protein